MVAVGRSVANRTGHEISNFDTRRVRSHALLVALVQDSNEAMTGSRSSFALRAFFFALFSDVNLFSSLPCCVRLGPVSKVRAEEECLSFPHSVSYSMSKKMGSFTL